jgi:hypothetical protein
MSEAEQSQSSEIGLADAARRITALSEGSNAQAEPVKPDVADAEVDETEAAAYDADETPRSEGRTPDDGSDDGGEADDVADDEGGKEKPLDLNTLVTVKIDGKTMQVPLREAVEGYQRQSDYSRNIVAIKEEKQRLDLERAQMKQALDMAIPLLQSQVEVEPDWAAIHRDDPINYPILRDQWRDRQEKLNAMRYEQARLQQAQQEQEMAARQKLVEEGGKYLAQTFKEWAEPEKRQAATRELRSYGVKQGFTEEELGQVYDPRYVVILEKARRYDALQSNRPKPVKQEGPKPMRGGANTSTPMRGNDMQRVQQRLKATGHVNDAAAYFSLLDSRRK